MMKNIRTVFYLETAPQANVSDHFYSLYREKVSGGWINPKY